MEETTEHIIHTNIMLIWLDEQKGGLHELANIQNLTHLQNV